MLLEPLTINERSLALTQSGFCALQIPSAVSQHDGLNNVKKDLILVLCVSHTSLEFLHVSKIQNQKIC